MSNVKNKFSLSFIMLLVLIMSLGSVFAGEIIFNLTGTYNGKTLTNGSTIEVSSSSSRTINVSVDAKYTKDLKIGYIWDSDARQIASENSKTATITIPNFAAGTSHILQVEALINDFDDNYIGNSNVLTITVKVPSKTTVDVNLKNGNTTLRDGATVEKGVGETLTIATSSNSTVKQIAYRWNSEDLVVVNGSTATIKVPAFAEGSTNTLKIQAMSEDGIYSDGKTYTVKIPVTTPIDDELIVEPWMKEDNTMEELAVSLRNDSDEYEKGNKNFYALDEEIVYYVDYKNGGDDITKEVKLVLELPLSFEVIDAFGGEVDTSKKTITWTFPDGLEEDEAGTKVVKIAYTSLGKASKKYEIVYPVADIYQRNKVVDSSAVINYIFKDEDTEITDEHYPYMFGDEGKTTFRPDDTISRAEGALVLTRIFGIDTSGTKVTDVFPDLNETYVEAQKAIVAATNLGLVNGFPDGTYRPNAKMTKAEFMKIIATYIEANAEDDDIRGLDVKTDTNIKIYKNSTSVYVTGSSTTNRHWASDWVTLLVRLNMTPVSSSSKNLGLDDGITRAEVAQLVNFYLLRAPADVSSSTKTQFSDVRRHKLLADIVEATREEHNYTITNEGYEVEAD